MDDIFSIVFFIWFAFTLFSNFINKKRPLPPPEHLDDQQDIEPIVFETLQQNKELNELSTQSKNSQQKSHSTQIDISSQFTPMNVQNAFILSEIFGKPKALRRR